MHRTGARETVQRRHSSDILTLSSKQKQCNEGQLTKTASAHGNGMAMQTKAASAHGNGMVMQKPVWKAKKAKAKEPFKVTRAHQNKGQTFHAAVMMSSEDTRSRQKQKQQSLCSYPCV